MKVLLKEDVDNLGYAGEVHTVADGYGATFCCPRVWLSRPTPTPRNRPMPGANAPKRTAPNCRPNTTYCRTRSAPSC